MINESITINLSATSNTSYTYNTKAPSIIASLKSNSISGNVLNSLAFNFNSGTGNIITYNNGNSLKVQMPSNSSFATAGNYLYIISSKMQNDFLNSTNTIIVYNDIIPNSIKISILKAAPAVLLKTPRNTVYNGSSVLTYYGTFTQFNQIPVRLYANNAIVSNTVIGILNSTVSGNFDFPLGIAISPNGAYAYVVNNGNSNISVINTSTSKVVRTISGFNYSDGVAFSPNGAYAYVSSDAYLYVNSETALLQSDNLSIVNTSTGSRIGTIAGFNEPLSVAIAPSGAYAYVMNNQNNTISIVNTSTRSIIGTISGFSFPYGMAISSNGTNAYVSNYGVSQVWLINGLTHSGYEPIISIISSFPFAAGLEGVAFLPTDSYIYVAGINYNKIAIINTSTNEVVSTIPISSPAYIAVSPSGAYAYVTDPTDNYISIINTGFGSYKLSAAGTYSLTANTPGNVNYTSNTASASFTIAKATPTLQLNVCSNYTYSGSAGCLITASINSFGNQLKGYLYINGNVVANSTSTSNTITFTAHEGAGNYSVVFNTTGNRNYTSNSIKKDFTIAKASPSITFPVFPQNFVYNGSTATVEAEISTYNNQLQANAFVNNALVSSFYSSNDFAVGPAAGNYTITANTLGNGNYTPISVSRIFTIIPAPVHSSSSTSSLYITDNVNKTYASNRSVFDVYLINYSDNAKVLNITYYQNQLPAEISFPAHYYVRFNFACAFTANGNYYVSNNTYGLLDSVPCGTNYTTTGGSYSAYYLKMIIPTTTTTTTTTTTVTTTTLPSISITNKGYEVSLNIAPHERSKITITQLHIALNIYSNYTKNITEDVTIKNVTSTMPSVPISYHTISGFNISATPKVPAINTTVTYACSLNPSQIKPLMFVNGTWMPVTDYSINQSACSIAFFASAPAVVAVATTQNITTTIPATTATTTILPVAKPTPNYEEYAIIVVIVVLAIIIIAYAAMKATAKGSR
ncbi:YncE family protein [Candidatus Marsarchaeota archaeon]|nr:YncE family protein [Candidatus Marsarchaeota archaeon]